jgi:hypothetical protein
MTTNVVSSDSLFSFCGQMIMVSPWFNLQIFFFKSDYNRLCLSDYYWQSIMILNWFYMCGATGNFIWSVY